MTTLDILSGGAAQGAVAGLAETLRAQTGFAVHGEFGAVGMMADCLHSGGPADLVILTEALVTRLIDEKLLLAASVEAIVCGMAPWLDRHRPFQNVRATQE